MTRLSRRALLALAVLAAAVVAAAIVVPLVALGGSSGRTVSAHGYRFTLPAGWEPLLSVPNGVLAGYERSDHTGLLTISSEQRRVVVSPRFIHGLDAQFQRRLDGYVPLSSRILVTSAGPTFLFTYTQTAGGRLTSILLVPGNGRSYVLDAVTNPTSQTATRDVAGIFKSFVPRG